MLGQSWPVLQGKGTQKCNTDTILPCKKEERTWGEGFLCFYFYLPESQSQNWRALKLSLGASAEGQHINSLSKLQINKIDAKYCLFIQTYIPHLVFLPF